MSIEQRGAVCPSGTDDVAGSAGSGVPGRRCPPEPRRTAPVEGTAASVAGTVVAAVVGEAGAVVAAASAPGTAGAAAAVAGTRTGADIVCGAGPAATAYAMKQPTGAQTWSH